MPDPDDKSAHFGEAKGAANDHGNFPVWDSVYLIIYGRTIIQISNGKHTLRSQDCPVS